jgi:hypothetical protein
VGLILALSRSLKEKERKLEAHKQEALSFECVLGRDAVARAMQAGDRSGESAEDRHQVIEDRSMYSARSMGNSSTWVSPNRIDQGDEHARR